MYCRIRIPWLCLATVNNPGLGFARVFSVYKSLNLILFPTSVKIGQVSINLQTNVHCRRLVTEGFEPEFESLLLPIPGTAMSLKNLPELTFYL